MQFPVEAVPVVGLQGPEVEAALSIQMTPVVQSQQEFCCLVYPGSFPFSDLSSLYFLAM